MNYKYGCLQKTQDNRDYQVKLERLSSISVPPQIDLVDEFMPPIWNQLDLGSCTAFGISACFIYNENKAGYAKFDPSQLFLYYCERFFEGDIERDGGAQIRTGMKCLSTTGICRTDICPYNTNNFAIQPIHDAYVDALKHKSIIYESVPQDLIAIKQVLTSGEPIVIGITCFPSFQSQAVIDSGIIPMPSADENSEGGHCMLCVGYSDSTSTFKLRNSWGTGIGMNGTGYFEIPYSYLTDPNLAQDFWCVKSVEKS